MKKTLLLALACIALFSCKKTEEINPLVIPSAYNAATFEANAEAEK